MFGIKLNNQFLALYPKTTFGFELHSPAYLGDKVDEIANGLIFSTKIPLTGDNAVLLKYPHVVENGGRFLVNAPCQIYKNGRVVFLGELTVKKATPQYVREPYAEVTIAINTVLKLKDTKMSELAMGTLSTTGILDLAKQTLLFPLNHPYIFYPVYNAIFSSGKFIQNQWDGTGLTLTFINRIGEVVHRGSALTPHLRISFILQKIFDHIGYSFTNSWQTNDELQLLTQVGYGCMNTIPDEFPSDFALNRALSATMVSSWLGKLCRTFGLVLSLNVFERTAELVPFQDVLKGTVKRDWTPFLLRGGELSEQNNYPKSLTFKKAEGSPVPDISQLPTTMTTTLPTFDAVEGLYEVGNIIVVYHRKKEDIGDGTQPDIIVQKDTIANINGGKESWEIDVSTLPQADMFYGTESGYYYIPITEQIGKMPSGDERDTPDHWLFYRGMHTQNGHTFPLATSESVGFMPLNMLTNVAPQYDLNWNGTNGIFSRFWVYNFDFLATKRDVTLRLLMPLDDFMQFSFADKVRVKNMEYLVKTLRGALKSEGDMLEIEADLVTIV